MVLWRQNCIVRAVPLNHEVEKEEEEVKRSELAESGRRMQDRIRAPLYLPAYERDIGERVSRLDFAERSSANTYGPFYTGCPVIFAIANAHFSEENDRSGNVDRFTSVLHGSIPWSGTSSNFSFTRHSIFILYCSFSSLVSFSLLINFSFDFHTDKGWNKIVKENIYSCITRSAVLNYFKNNMMRLIIIIARLIWLIKRFYQPNLKFFIVILTVLMKDAWSTALRDTYMINFY